MEFLNRPLPKSMVYILFGSIFFATHTLHFFSLLFHYTLLSYLTHTRHFPHQSHPRSPLRLIIKEQLESSSIFVYLTSRCKRAWTHRIAPSGDSAYIETYLSRVTQAYLTVAYLTDDLA